MTLAKFCWITPLGVWCPPISRRIGHHTVHCWRSRTPPKGHFGATGQDMPMSFTMKPSNSKGTWPSVFTQTCAYAIWYIYTYRYTWFQLCWVRMDQQNCSLSLWKTPSLNHLSDVEPSLQCSGFPSGDCRRWCPPGGLGYSGFIRIVRIREVYKNKEQAYVLFICNHVHIYIYIYTLFISGDHVHDIHHTYTWYCP